MCHVRSKTDTDGMIDITTNIDNRPLQYELEILNESCVTHKIEVFQGLVCERAVNANAKRIRGVKFSSLPTLKR